MSTEIRITTCIANHPDRGEELIRVAKKAVTEGIYERRCRVTVNPNPPGFNAPGVLDLWEFEFVDSREFVRLVRFEQPPIEAIDASLREAGVDMDKLMDKVHKLEERWRETFKGQLGQ